MRANQRVRPSIVTISVLSRSVSKGRRRRPELIVAGDEFRPPDVHLQMPSRGRPPSSCRRRPDRRADLPALCDASSRCSRRRRGCRALRRRRAARRRRRGRRARAAPARRAALGAAVRLRHASDDLREPARLRRAGRRATRSSRAGSPNSGNSVSVSRKNVNSTIRPSDELQHLQRPRLVAVARSRSACTARTPASRSRGRRDHPRAPDSRSPARTTTRGCRRARAATGRTAAWTASRPPGSATSAPRCRTRSNAST